MFSGGPPIHLMWSNMYNPEKQKLKGQVEWRRIGALFLPYWKMQTAVFFLILLGSILGLAPAVLTLSIIDKAIPSHNFTTLAIDVGLMVGASLLAGLAGVYQGYLNSKVGEGIIRDLHAALVSHLHKMPLEFFTATKTGEIMNRVSNDVESVDNVVTMTMVSIISNILTIITTVVAIFAIDWRLSLISLLVVPVMVLPLWPVGRKMYDARKKTRTKRDEMQAATQETLSVSGIVLVKSFVREGSERKRFYNLASQLMDLEINVAMIGRWFLMAITSMVTIGPAIIWLSGGWLAIYDGVTVGVLVSFVALLARLYTPVSALAGVQVQVVSALAVFERIFDYLDMKEERDPEGAITIESVEGKVTFEGVTFRYPSGRAAVEDLSFVVEPGSMVAFVGPSGAGKTTVTNLVPRLYEAQEGRILLDQYDTKTVTMASLREQIGIVTQETFLFHDTIKANLRYAREGAADQDVIEACKAANIHDVIMAMPEGYDTVVGERGHKLSGGERQRLAIARVLLKNPRVLILDEATSSLDTENEKLIQAALVPLMKGRTSLVVAHRLSTVINADRIFVVDQGRIVESGTHTELLEKGGLYTRLYMVH
ncbi:MAG: ABC transporter ATP-binding protein [Cyanobacteria bacterium SZAS LIN-2]|nr:ABC transporter ATP-binding protein [Cyanobacteria bacterium SZAS LIN-2]